MAAIIQTTFSNGFSWVRMYGFRLSFHWSFFLGGTINLIPALAQTMPWCRPGDKPLSEPVVVSLLTRICIARPQWVKYDYNLLILCDNRNGKPIGLQFTTREGILKHWNSMVEYTFIYIHLETRWLALWQHFRQWKLISFSSFTEVSS